MFFQLSLPSTPPTADTTSDSVLPELGTAGTLTIEAQDRLEPEHAARLFAARVREAKNALRCRVGPSLDAPVTFTAAAAAHGDAEAGLQ
jgi:hypothetical protein